MRALPAQCAQVNTSTDVPCCSQEHPRFKKIENQFILLHPVIVRQPLSTLLSNHNIEYFLDIPKQIDGFFFRSLKVPQR